MRAIQAALLLLTAASCVPSIESVARRGTEPAVDEAAKELTDEETAARLASFATDPRVRMATRELARSVVSGAFFELTDEQQAERLERALANYSSTIGASVGAGVLEALARELPRLRESLTAAADANGPGALTRASGALTEGISRAFAQGLEHELGDSIEEVIREDVAVGLQRALDERLNEALGRTARVVGREAMLGVGEGFDQVVSRGGALSELGRGARAGAFLLQLLAVAGAIGVIVLGILLWRAQRTRGELRRESERKDAALKALVGAIHGAEHRPWADELLEVLRERLRDQEGGDYVREQLRRDPSLRLRRKPRPDEPSEVRD